jgi:hypothetical protein
MNNDDKSVEVKNKNLTLSLIVAWIYGVLAGLTGIFQIPNAPLVGIIFLISAIIVLPPTYNWLKDKLHFSLSKTLKVVIVLILIAIAGSMSGSEKSDQNSINNNVTNNSNQNMVSEQPVVAIKVTAVKLSEDYKANEVSADAKYKGKFIEVTGIIDNIAKDIMDTPYVTLKTDTYSIISIQCMFDKNSESQLATLSKGQSITLQGEVSGKLMNVIVKGCVIKN